MSRSASLSRGGRCERGFCRCPIWDKTSLTRLINLNPNDIVADMEPETRDEATRLAAIVAERLAAVEGRRETAARPPSPAWSEPDAMALRPQGRPLRAIAEAVRAGRGQDQPRGPGERPEITSHAGLTA
jgi:hypothetical protein